MLLKGKEIRLGNFRELSHGGFNIAYECDTNSRNFNKVVIRTTTALSKAELTDTIYENLKHVILYLINRCNIGKQYKLIPQPLYFGLYEKRPHRYQIFFIMEKGDSTLNTKIEEKIPKMLNNTFDHEDKQDIRKLVYSFYNSLLKLNKVTDYFSHSDSKFNNVLLKDGKILLIYFGYTSFKFYDLVFKSASNHSIHYTSMGKNFNAVQDLCQMLFSFYLIINQYLYENKLDTPENTNNILLKLNQSLQVEGKTFIGYHIYFHKLLLNHLKEKETYHKFGEHFIKIIIIGTFINLIIIYQQNK
ncbi:hypothetical protein crov135 [Cafeteria roenbergensis virus]|uniref:Protein kinase domain-containing protein n=1 Tax=Cafeteria roenbergensis virus (strain BV-PW1) TaxID=693272 RepID=E3T4Q5_CROVB|nr:hypothetical protein crov135 [Cafeteria roenbergensis virus BV-PW1]ADO67168.1 hypothetical protein crov135 [Cafeteria roenbergensis virus BV-PW1]